jgi:hypothetical protein
MPNASLILTAIALVLFASFWHGFARADDMHPIAAIHAELLYG